MVPLKWRDMETEESAMTATAADDEAADEDEASNESMEYLLCLFVQGKGIMMLC